MIRVRIMSQSDDKGLVEVEVRADTTEEMERWLPEAVKDAMVARDCEAEVDQEKGGTVDAVASHQLPADGLSNLDDDTGSLPDVEGIGFRFSRAPRDAARCA